ncbi:hypothetical protein FQR65_LT20811 [Abscondita terminalis]|nr:hypothetical protein FQR65_LT20811 [Abscondita terminalis]
MMASSIDTRMDKVGYDIPLLAEPAAAGELSRRGLLPRRGLPAVIAELIRRASSKPRFTANGKTLEENCKGAFSIAVSCYLEPQGPDGFEGRAIVFDGPEDYHHAFDDPALAHRRALHPGSSARRAGFGYPGAAEVVNMRADYLNQEGHHRLRLRRRWPSVRTSGSPSDPQRLAGSGDGGGLACSRWATRSGIDLRAHRQHPDLG